MLRASTVINNSKDPNSTRYSTSSYHHENRSLSQSPTNKLIDLKLTAMTIEEIGFDTPADKIERIKAEKLHCESIKTKQKKFGV
jgi:hypothetical protein